MEKMENVRSIENIRIVENILENVRKTPYIFRIFDD